MNVFKQVIANEHMDIPTSIQCILTGYEIISGQGESLNLDMKDFSLLLYTLLFSLMEGNGEYVPLAVSCLDHLIIKKKQLSAERVAAYAKRLSSVSLHLPSHAALCSMAMVGIILQVCFFFLLFLLRSPTFHFSLTFLLLLFLPSFFYYY
jgi:hypothetical protein